MAIWTLALGALAVANSQQVGLLQEDEHPQIPLMSCTLAGGCTSEKAALTFDANSRWQHGVDCDVPAGAACYPLGECVVNGKWNTTFCGDPVACAKNCAVEGVNFKHYDKHGVFHVENGVELKFVEIGKDGMAISNRLYLLAADDTNYKQFKLKNREFAFTVDTSTLPCGANGALYFVEMPVNGGLSDTNKAGAKYGTGYCDAQCPKDSTFLEGKANLEEWNAAEQTGKFGHCCAEIDVWEANSMASSFKMHPCKNDAQFVCSGPQCTGQCDAKGCGFNSLRLGEKFFGKGAGFAVDTSKPMTVVTQFLTTDGTDAGELQEIKRVFMQDGKVISHSSDPAGNSATAASCRAHGDTWGMQKTSAALDRGLVLTLSLWEDKVDKMKWLDEVDGKPGPCTGQADIDYKQALQTSVKYSNLMYGEIGSTLKFMTTGGKAKALRLDEVPLHDADLQERILPRRQSGALLLLGAAVPLALVAFVAARRLRSRLHHGDLTYGQLPAGAAVAQPPAPAEA